MIEVHVQLAGVDVLAGRLFPHRRRGSESATFSYEPGFLTTPGAYALDPALPLAAGAFQTPVGAALFGAFTDAAPDRWGRTLLQRKELALAQREGRAARSLGAVDHLLGVRDDLRQGALRFAEAGEFLADERSGVPALTDLPSLLALADRADAGGADLEDLQRLVKVGSSLGGARPKAHVRTPAGTLAIAKFPSAARDTWDVMAWEKVVLDLAQAAGVAVPRSSLLTLAGRRVLVLDRFDRDGDLRVGYVSAMTMLEAEDGDRRSYPELAEVLEAVSSAATKDLHQLFRRIVLSLLVSNRDDHLRNHGFLRTTNGWRLSPAFDLNPDPSPGSLLLSTSVDGTDAPSTLAQALSVAALFRLSDVQSAQVVAGIRSAVSAWPQVASRHGLTAAQQREMAPAFRIAPT